MKKQVLILTIVFLVALFATSCLNPTVVEDRTAADEQGELAELLQNLSAKGNNIDTTALGVYYIRIAQGTGEFAKTGDTVSVIYAAYFFDGTMFDASYLHSTDSLFTFVLGTPPMIKGWDDGMTVLNKNSMAQLIIPSSLAYGSTGTGGIQPYQPLIFVVKMKSIKPKK